MSTFREYSSDSVYFIAGGETLEIIKQFEEDVKNYEAQLDAIAKHYGAESMYDAGAAGFTFTMHHKSSDPALAFDAEYEGRDGKPTRYLYKVNKKKDDKGTDEGQTLQKRLEDIPRSTCSYSIFAKRLTGAKFVSTNPDNLFDREDYDSRIGHYETENKDLAASYTKYGDVYVVEVPRTIRGIGIQFNEASEKDFRPAGKTATGYEYDWFTPPDSKLIPYSEVIARQEKELGDQTTPRKVRAALEIQPPLTRY